jgi:BON domain
MRQHFSKLAMIVVLGSGFAVAQSTPSTPQSTSPNAPQSAPSSTDQTPAATPDQGKNPANAPESMPSTDQKPTDSSKLPQSDAAPTSASGSGDVQGNIQSAIQKDPSLASSNVTVNVTEGKSVDLTGTVPTKDAKDAAERIAKENAGTLKVKNHLKIAASGADSTPKTDTSAPKL